jgi:hypothetical protein
MIRKFKDIIDENRSCNQINTLFLEELNWANIFHDSIKGDKWINQLSLNIGRWSGGYSFFYVLTRILKDVKPKKILELGLGESTKVISNFIDFHSFYNIKHLIIEHDDEWKINFLKSFNLSNNSKIEICPLIKNKFKGCDVLVYNDFEENIKELYDFVLVDGPYGSQYYSRSEILKLVEKYSISDRFLILFDDTNRKGEKQTVNEIECELNKRKIPYHIKEFGGLKECTLICSEEFKFLISI